MKIANITQKKMLRAKYFKYTTRLILIIGLLIALPLISGCESNMGNSNSQGTSNMQGSEGSFSDEMDTLENNDGNFEPSQSSYGDDINTPSNQRTLGSSGGSGDTSSLPTSIGQQSGDTSSGGYFGGYGYGSPSDNGNSSGYGDFGGSDGSGGSAPGGYGNYGGSNQGSPSGYGNYGGTNNPSNNYDNSSNSTQTSASNSSPQMSSGEKPVIIIAHGLGANGSMYSGLASRFQSAGYETLTPSGSDPYGPNHVIEAANQTGDKKVILVGHSAGGAAVQKAAAQLQGKAIGVISIDGAPSNITDPNIPHAFFRHSNDSFGSLVGNVNPSVPQENLINGGVKTLPGGHIEAATGGGSEEYIAAAKEIEARTKN